MEKARQKDERDRTKKIDDEVLHLITSGVNIKSSPVYRVYFLFQSGSFSRLPTFFYSFTLCLSLYPCPRPSSFFSLFSLSFLQPFRFHPLILHDSEFASSCNSPCLFLATLKAYNKHENKWLNRSNIQTACCHLLFCVLGCTTLCSSSHNRYFVF